MSFKNQLVFFVCTQHYKSAYRIFYDVRMMGMKGEIFLMKYSKKDYLRYESTCKKRKVLNEA